ncbi:MAG: hypothetical protein EZS28_049693, partial [Streblomastix strix]
SQWVISRNCSFENIQVSGINGSIISETMLGSGTSLRIENTNISECKTIAERARGAAINFGIERGKENFYFSDVTFPKASIAQDTQGEKNIKWDNVIFIRADDLTERLPNSNKIHFADDTNSGWKYAGSDRLTKEIPLYYLWHKYSSDTVHVTSDTNEIDGIAGGRNVLYCGREEYPCETLVYGYKQFDELKPSHTFVIHKTVNLVEQIILAKSITFSSYKPLSQAEIHVDRAAQIDAKSISNPDPEVKFNRIKILIENDLNDTTSPLITASGNNTSIIVRKCNITKSYQDERYILKNWRQ